MKSRKKVILSVFAVLCAVVLIVFAVVQNRRKTEFDMSEKSFVAMGTVVTAKVYGSGVAGHTENIRKTVNSVENAVSWRVPGSPAAVLNKKGSAENDVLASVLKECIGVSQKSGGAFDVSVGELTRLWDFDSGKELVPDEPSIKKALTCVGYEKIRLDGSGITIGKNQKIDLGAVGKGFACDAAAAYLEKSGAEGAVVSVGGSIAAFGRRNRAGDPWRIAVRDPENENGILGTVLLENGFVSTSGNYEKFFIKNGRRYHHLLDPKTGFPAGSGLSSVTVTAKTGLLSDALSTACFVLGRAEGEKLLSEYGAAGIFVSDSGEISTFGDIRFERSK